MTTTYLYRRGDGNEGNFIRAIVELKDDQSPYAALRALVVNDYIPGRSVRRHIIKNVEIDGEADFGLDATVYEGPKGETAFGAAYLTAALEPLNEKDLARYVNGSQLPRLSIPSCLDRGARRIFREHNRA